MTSPVGSPRARRVVLLLAVLMTLAALIQGHHRASKGRNALLRWEPVYEALERGEPIYETGAEGYPTLPVTLLLMAPFRALGPTLGPLAWAAFKLLLAWWMVLAALRLAGGAAGRWPPWALALVLLLSFRVLHSDVQHGNLNLVVGATVVAALVSLARGRALVAGTWIGLGGALKVTPLLGVLWLARKGSARGVLGVALGLALGVLAPGPWLGFERSLELAGRWWEQMIVPYVAGRELTLLQTEHINQSLLGVLSRWTTDGVAIEARPPVHPTDVRVDVLSLSPGAFRALHLAASATVGVALLLLWRRGRAPLRLLGEVALLGLGMLLLSERSWKHHYVLLPLPVVFLAWQLVQRRHRGVAGAGLALAFGLFGLTGEAFLGERWSDLAEAWGAYLLGALVLFAACGAVLARDDTLSSSAP